MGPNVTFSNMNFSDCIIRYLVDSFAPWQSGGFCIPVPCQRDLQCELVTEIAQSMVHDRRHVFLPVWLPSSPWV